MSGPGRFTTAINEMGLTTPLSVAAAGFAGAGVPVFPCAPGGKHPITEHGFHEATTNLAQVRQWWRRFPKANIGVPTGRPSGVGVCQANGVTGLCCHAGLGLLRRPSNRMSKALRASFHLWVQRALPLPVGSSAMTAR